MTIINRWQATSDHINDHIREYAAKMGYALADTQSGFLPSADIEMFWLSDLAAPNELQKPYVRVLLSTIAIDELSEKHFNEVRKAFQHESVAFLAFTNDGQKYRTITKTGSGEGSIDFIPRNASNIWDLPILSVRDLQPFLSIYDLRLLVSRLSDNIYSSYGHDRLRLFDTILQLLVVKIFDEINNPHDLYIPKMLRKQDTELQAAFLSFCQQALEAMQCESFTPTLHSDVKILRDALQMIAPYSFRLTIETGAQTEVLGTFYQEAVSSTFRGSLGAYFTPRPIADLASSLCEPSITDDIFDISCGSGTFLLSAFMQARQTNGSLRKDGPRLFGCDIQERMVLTATLNSFLHGADEAHVIHGDALHIDLKKWHGLNPSVPEEGFSLIVGNPPFAGFESEEHLPYNQGPTAKVNKIIPFIVKTVQLLRPGGRAALVIPTSVLNAESNAFTDLRKWLASQVEVMAVVGLPKDAFIHTDCGVEGAILVFKRRSEDAPTAKVFFKNLTNIGYDRRGQPTAGSEVNDTIELWKRQEESYECWISREQFYHLDRWDPTWIEGYKKATSYNTLSHIRLTEICTIIKRTLSKQRIHPEASYRYFEVGDTNMDTGEIVKIHAIKGRDLSKKGRLQVLVEEGDILLPNHRDSLVTKTAARTGRSAVIVTAQEAGCITSNRFTVLRPLIHPKLLILILNSDFVRMQLVLHARGSASFDIRDKVLTQIWVPKRILEDQELQQEVISAIERREQLQHLLHEADKHLTHLMQVFSE